MVKRILFGALPGGRAQEKVAAASYTELQGDQCPFATLIIAPRVVAREDFTEPP